jgi:uncharacterized low-complexity protein
MKHFNQISKILLSVVAIIGLTIGMSSIYGFNSLPDGANATALADSSKKAVQDSKCGDGKCGGDEAKADVKDAKCGEGKCGGDEAKTTVSDKVDEVKADVKDAKCGVGKCG